MKPGLRPRACRRCGTGGVVTPTSAAALVGPMTGPELGYGTETGLRTSEPQAAPEVPASDCRGTPNQRQLGQPCQRIGFRRAGLFEEEPRR